MLLLIAEELGDASDEHFPGGVKAGIVQIGKMAYGRGEMTRESDGAVE